jgi:hypothetical protein
MTGKLASIGLILSANDHAESRDHDCDGWHPYECAGFRSDDLLTRILAALFAGLFPRPRLTNCREAVKRDRQNRIAPQVPGGNIR